MWARVLRKGVLYTIYIYIGPTWNATKCERTLAVCLLKLGLTWKLEMKPDKRVERVRTSLTRRRTQLLVISAVVVNTGEPFILITTSRWLSSAGDVWPGSPLEDAPADSVALRMERKGSKQRGKASMRETDHRCIKRFYSGHVFTFLRFLFNLICIILFSKNHSQKQCMNM